MSEANFVLIYLVDAEIFHWITENLELLVALVKKLRDHHSDWGSSSWELECNTKPHGSPQDDYLSRCFALDQICLPTDPLIP